MDQYFYFNHQFEGTAHGFILPVLHPSHLLTVSQEKLLPLSFAADAAVTGPTLLVTTAVLVQSQRLANGNKLDIEALA